MSAKVDENKETLVLLGDPHCHKTIKLALLQHSNPGLLKAIVEICHNVFHGNVDLTPEEIEKLRRYKPLFEELTDKRIARKRKIKTLQSGTGLNLLTLLLPTVLRLVGSLIKK